MSIGESTHIFSRIKSSEPFLISIGYNVTISTGVTLLTHDASIGAITKREVYSDLVGPINIGNNAFLGANAIVLPGVTIPNGSIVAAGSVVTKTITPPTASQPHTERGIVIAGNPAKFICFTDEFVNRRKDNFLKLHGSSVSERKNIILQNKEKWVNK